MTTTNEKLYTVQLTHAELASLLAHSAAAEHLCLEKGIDFTSTDVEAYMKVSDAMQQYYDDNGITD